ncbi:MAG: TolC family protein [Thermoanaerobaculia bacterium]
MNDRISRLLAAAGLAAALPALGQAPAPPGPEALTVRRAAELALERAPHLASTRAAREESDAEASLARDAFHPSAWFTSTPGYTYGLPSTVAGRVPAVAGVEIRQTLYDPARRSGALQAEAAAAGVDAALERACRETVEAAVGAYARCFMDQDRIASARRRVDAAEAIVERVEALTQEGRRTELELERAKLQAARARLKLLNAESDRDLDQLELKRLIGWPGSSPLILAGDPDGVIPELQAAENLAATRAADPELSSLGREVELLRRSVKLESKRFGPIIEAAAQYQRLAKFNDYDKYYLTFTPDNVSIGVTIGIPLWTGGRYGDGVRRARARLEHAEAQLRSRESDLEITVRRAEAAVARSIAEKSLSRRSQGIAEQDLSTLQLLVREGRSELSDLDERELALADADEEAARAELGSVLERVRLLALRGDLSRALLGFDPPCAAP